MKIYSMSSDLRDRQKMFVSLITREPPYQIEFLHYNPKRVKAGKIGDCNQFLRRTVEWKDPDDFIGEYPLFSQKAYDVLRDLLEYPGSQTVRLYYENQPFYLINPAVPFSSNNLTTKEVAEELPDSCHYFTRRIVPRAGGSCSCTQTFYERVQQHKLKGFDFDLYWDDEQMESV